MALEVQKEAGRQELVNLQILRGIAAMLVVTNHFLSGTVAGVFRNNGGFGVDIFFVLSGFLMIHTLTHHKTPVNFFFSRVKRIYPLYVILSLPLILSWVPLRDGYHFIGNILLLPGLNDPNYKLANSPAWTLVYEMLFYVIFSIALVFSRKKTWTCIIVCSAILLSVLFTNGYERLGWINLGFIMGDSLMINFAAGCAIALLYTKLKNLHISAIFFVVFSIVLFWLALVELDGRLRIVKFGIPAMTLIMIAIACKAYSGPFKGILKTIGDASYSIYLSHIYLTFVFHNMRDVNNDWFVTLYSSVCFVVISVLLGLFVYKNIEQPINNYLKSRSKAP